MKTNTYLLQHVAIIADGNRRWAEENSLPFDMGYLQGLNSVESCCEWAINQNITYLTIYCFSTENWNRPKNQIDRLMEIANTYFVERLDWFTASDIRVSFAGRKDRFETDMVKKLDEVERATKNCKKLQLTICADYGGRDEIVRAIEAGARTEEEISQLLDIHAPDPDLIIRTGGNMRLSNFMLWQSAYSELLFTPVHFPALDARTLDLFVEEYNSRLRTFGA